jgi:hypothetical protein
LRPPRRTGRDGGIEDRGLAKPGRRRPVDQGGLRPRDGIDRVATHGLTGLPRMTTFTATTASRPRRRRPRARDEPAELPARRVLRCASP